MDLQALDDLEAGLSPALRERVMRAVSRVAAAKEQGGKVAVVTGSGPNLHEGVTTLVAELMRAGVVDAVTTSSAVVAHEMGGTLDRVKRCPGEAAGVDRALLPRGGEFELTQLSADRLERVARDVTVDRGLIEKLENADGVTIIKAAGNLGYPMGLWLEHVATQVGTAARAHGIPFEEAAGLGADERTMIGIGARTGLPVLVTIPQLIGGGKVGLAIGDSLTITERASRLAHMLDEADVIIESGVALTQEIHDGPLELHTGHGLWSAWLGEYAYSLEGKSLIRIDLDPALEAVWQAEQQGGAVQETVARGLPKTKTFGVPFRMEMSGFARHEGSLPIVGDLGAVWPVLARRVTERLGVTLEFMSYPQQTPQGQAMRDAIVRDVKPFELEAMRAALNERRGTEAQQSD